MFHDLLTNVVVANFAEADLRPDWRRAAEKGFGDGARAVEEDYIPPKNCNSTRGTSKHGVLLSGQNRTCPPVPGGGGQTTSSQTQGRCL